MGFDRALNDFPPQPQKCNLLLDAPHKAAHTQLGIGVYLSPFPLAAARYQDHPCRAGYAPPIPASDGQNIAGRLKDVNNWLVFSYLQGDILTVLKRNFMANFHLRHDKMKEAYYRNRLPRFLNPDI